MKPIAAILLLAFLAFVTPAAVQAQIHTMKVHVPFRFVAGDQTMPPGDYTVSVHINESLLLRSADLRHTAVLATLRNHFQPGGDSLVVFSKYGDRHFLRCLASPHAYELNVTFPVSKLEKGIGSGTPVLVDIKAK